MNLTIPRDALLPALAALNRVVEKRNTIPVLSNILLRAENGALALKATDLDIEATASAPADIAAPGAITAPAAMLHDIARKLPADAAITLEAADGRMTVRAGRSRFTLQTLPEEDFPDISAGELPHSFALAAEAVTAMADKVAFAISTEETRYYLNGIFMHVAEGADGTLLTFVATDGHRLSRLGMPAPAGTEGMPGVIIPRKAVGEIARLAAALPKETLRFSVSPSKIRVEAGPFALVSKLIDASFPDYKRVIPSGNDKRAVLDAAALRAALDRVSTISSERGRAVKLSLGEGALRLSVSNPDAGDAAEEIDADYDAAPLEIGFNARYLLDILGALGGDTVLIKLADPGSPTILQTRDGAEHLTVLMPMRVNS